MPPGPLLLAVARRPAVRDAACKWQHLLIAVYGFDALLVTTVSKLLDVRSFQLQVFTSAESIVHCIKRNRSNAA